MDLLFQDKTRDKSGQQQHNNKLNNKLNHLISDVLDSQTDKQSLPEAETQNDRPCLTGSSPRSRVSRAG